MEAIFGKALQLAHEYETEMGHFLRDLIAIPSPSGQERDVINRIAQETQVVGFDQVQIDPMGNLPGYIGHGKHLIAMDAHIDTVGVGNQGDWRHSSFTRCLNRRAEPDGVPPKNSLRRERRYRPHMVGSKLNGQLIIGRSGAMAMARRATLV